MNLGAGFDASAGNPIDPRPVLIVTGLVQEARIAAGPGMTVICSSSDPQQLRAPLTVFDPSTIRGVISFGVAGGLDPTLKSGDVVVATEVLSGDARWLAGLTLNEDLIARVALGRRRVVRGGLAGVEQVIAARAGKAAGWGIFLFVFLMVLREGVELALILRAVELSTEGLQTWIGTIAGIGAAVAVGLFFFKGTLRIQLHRFFAGTSVILMLVAFQLALTGLHELSEARLVRHHLLFVQRRRRPHDGPGECGRRTSAAGPEGPRR